MTKHNVTKEASLSRAIALIIFIAVISLGKITPGIAKADQPPEHLTVECATCHESHPGGDLPVDETCLTCHEPWLPQHDQVAGLFHSPEERACSRCHDYHPTQMLQATENTFIRPYGNPDVLNHCTSCHRSDNGLGAISEGHVAAAAQQYHVDSYLIEGVGLSQVCLNCHDEESGKPEAPPANQAFPAHGSHPVGTEIPKSSPWESSAFREVISPQLELFDDNIECITCHRIPEPAVFRLVPFPTVTDLCNGCHDMAPGIPPPVAAMGPAVTRLNSPTQLVGSYGPINH